MPGFTDFNFLTIAAAFPVCCSAAHHLASDEGNIVAGVDFLNAEIVLKAIFKHKVRIIFRFNVINLTVATTGHCGAISGISVNRRTVVMHNHGFTGGTGTHTAAKTAGAVGCNQSVCNIQVAKFLHKDTAAAPVKG